MDLTDDDSGHNMKTRRDGRAAPYTSSLKPMMSISTILDRGVQLTISNAATKTVSILNAVLVTTAKDLFPDTKVMAIRCML
jgi:hypothetical protein